MSVSSTATTTSAASCPSLSISSSLTSYSSTSSRSTTCSSSLIANGADSGLLANLSRVPTLDDILSDNAQEPFSLNEFTKYLSRNHCQEVLEFALDCEKYREAYYGWHNGGSNKLENAACRTTTLMHHTWNRIMDVFIKPDGAKEINISCSVRDALLSIDTKQYKEPVHPTKLDPALQQAKDLMKENALLQFVTNAKYRHFKQHNRSSASLTSMGQQHQARPQPSTPPPRQAAVTQPTYKRSRESSQSSQNSYCCEHYDQTVTSSTPEMGLETSTSPLTSSSTSLASKNDRSMTTRTTAACEKERVSSSKAAGHWRRVSQKFRFLGVAK